jgi:type II secretory pathway component GspD/PulD (secretin)
MAIKKIVLTSFAALASFTVIANNMMPVSAPAIWEEPAEVARREEPRAADTRNEPLSPSRFVPVQVTTTAPATEPMPQQMPVAMPRVVTAEEPIAIVDAEVAAVPEVPVVAAETATVIPVAASHSSLISEWLDVPRDVIERLSRAKAPSGPQPRVAKTAAKPQSLIEYVAGHISDSIYGRAPEAVPAEAPNRAETLMTAEPPRPIEMPRAEVTASVAQREIIQLPVQTAVAAPEIPVAKPAPAPIVAETAFLGISSVIARHLLLPAPAEPLVEAPRFATIEQPVSEVSSAVVEREMLSVPAAPVVPERAVAQFVPAPVVETDSVRPFSRPLQVVEAVFMPVAMAVYRRATLPAPAEPVVEAPALEQREVATNEIPRPTAVNSEIENIPSEVSTAIAQRRLLTAPSEPAVQAPEVKTEAPYKVLPFIETAIAQVSSAVYGRPQAAAPREPLARAEEIVVKTEPAKPTPSFVENAFAQLSTAVFGRPVAPVPSAPPVAQALPVNQTVAAAPSKQSVTLGKMPSDEVYAARTPAAPVLINSQPAYSPSMVMPFDLGPQPEMKSSPGSDRGPTVEAAAVKDTYANLKAIEKAKAVTVPVMISPTAAFSADMLKPMNTSPVYPPNPFSVLSEQAQPGSYCDPTFKGPPIRFAQTVDLKLDDLLGQLNARFGINFIVGPGVGSLPLSVKAGSIPWNVLLRSQLYVSGVRANCIDENTVELVLNNKVVELEKGRLEAEKLETRYIKLKYLQPSGGGNKNVAGQSTSGGGSNQGGSSQGGGGQGDCQQQQQNQGGASQGGGQQIPGRCKFERLIAEIKQMLGLNQPTALERIESPGISSVTFKQPEAGKRPYVGQVPGRNMLLVNATPSQLKDVEELIQRADIPPFQVVIRALVYTANEDKLKDIGVTASAIVGSGNLNTLGGVTSLPGALPTPLPGPNTIPPLPPGALQPGGIRTLGPGFTRPTGLGEGIFGFSTIIGTAQFSAQATALQRDGIISIKSRPFATVLDGDTTDLTVGRQVPVLIQAINPIGGAPGTLQILQAANLLSVTPHVIDDDNGNPTAVNLEIQLESNDVDSSVASQGVPAISVRSIQSNIILNQEQTAILGGFTVDSDSKTITKTPGLGDIPILGELFKRRVRSTQINRLYFAISVTVIPYGSIIEPVKVPGADPTPPTITEEMLNRAKAIDPKPLPTPSPTPRTKTGN